MAEQTDTSIERDLESLVLDPPGWLGRLPEDERAPLTRYLDQLETQPEKDAALRQYASQVAVSHAKQIPLVDVVENWDIARGGFAEQQGGEWRDTGNDDAKFYGQLQKRAQFGRDERQLIFGPDDDNSTGPMLTLGWERAAGLGGRQGGSADARRLGEQSLASLAQEAAFSGGTYAAALADWQESASNAPGYSAERRGEHERVAKLAFDRMSSALAKVRPVANEAFESMARGRSLTEGGGNIAPFQLFRSLNPQERDLAFRVMNERAADETGGGKEFWKATIEALGTGVENTIVGGDANKYRTRLMATQWKAGDRVSANDARSEFLLDEGARSAVVGGGPDGGGAMAVTARERGKNRVLTEEEAAKWNQWVADTIEDATTAEQMRKFSQSLNSGRSGDTFRDKYWLPAVESIPLMASMALPGVSAAFAFEQNANMYAGDNFLRLRAVHPDMTPAEAQRIAMISGVGQAGLDMLEFSALTKGLPFLRQSMQRMAFAGSRAVRFGVNTAGILAAETAIELTQDHIIPAAVQDLMSSNPQFDPNWGAVWSDLAASIPDTVQGMVLLSAFGGAMQTAGQTSRARWVGRMAENPAAMRLSGYSMAEIEQIQQAPELWQKSELLEKFDPQSRPAPTAATREALSADVLRLDAEEKATAGERLKNEDATGAAAADYAVSVRRSAAGWQVQQADGKLVSVSSAEAARKIRDDLLQASTIEEAASITALLDRFHEGDAAATSELTGERVEGKGGTIKRTRNGVEVGEITDAQALAEFQRETEMQAEATGDTEINHVVNGSNEFIQNVAEGTKTLLVKLNQSGSTALAAVHEHVEGRLRAAWASGAMTIEGTQRAIASIAPAFDPAMARDAEERSFRNRLQRVATGKASKTEIRETFSELAVADIIGRRRDGSVMPAGSISAALRAAIENAKDAATVGALNKFRAFLRAVRQYFRAVFGTVAAIKRARREGVGQDFTEQVNKLLGLDEQAKHEEDAASDAEALSDEYIPPTAEEQARGIAFSISQYSGRNVIHARPAIQLGQAAEGDMRTDPAFVYRTLSEDEIKDARRAGVFRPNPSGKSRGGREGVKHWVRGGEQFYRARSVRWVVRVPEASISEEEGKLVEFGAIEVFHSDGETFEQVSTGSAQDGPAFSVSPGKHMDLISQRIQSALKDQPEKRRAIQMAARENLERLRVNRETTRYTGKGDEIRPLVDQRSKASLDKEQAFRQADAFRAELEKGGLEASAASRSKDAKDYETWQRYQESRDYLMRSGWEEEKADEMAKIVGEKWRKDFVAKVKTAHGNAVASAQAWRDQQDAMQKEDWNPRESLLRDMRTLDAILSVLPAEIRGKVGGYIKLATLGTNKARLDEIGRRIDKTAELLEKHLRTEYSEALDDLFERAKPKKDGAGKKKVGKAGADVHALFDTLREAVEWTAEKAEAYNAGLQSEIDSGELSAEEEAHKTQEIALVNLLADWKNADAARRATAVNEATRVFRVGYAEFGLAKALQAASRQERRESLRQDTGKAGTQGERDERFNRDNGTSAKWGHYRLNLASFEQLLKYAFGDGSVDAQRLADLEREASFRKTDETQAAEMALQDLFTMLAGSVQKGAELHWALAQKSLKIGERYLSQLEAVAATMMWRQEDGRRHMEGKRDESGKLVTAWGYDQSFADELESKLSPEAKAVRNFLANDYNGEWPVLNPVYREMNGIDLPRHRNYSPLTVKPQQAGRGQMVDPVTGSVVSGTSTTPGSLRTRGSAVAEPDFRDAVQTWHAHKKQMAHWKAYAGLAAEMQSLLGNREVRNSVQAGAGEEAVNVLGSWVDYLAQGGTRDAAAHLALMRDVRGMSGRFASISLIGRISTLVVQSTQLGAALSEMPTGAYLKRLALLMSGNLGWGEALNSPYIQRRLAEMPPAARLAMDGLRASKPSRLKHAVQKLGWLISGSDALFTAGTYAIIHDYRKTLALEAGLPEADAQALATQEAERITDRVAQPTRPGARSMFENLSTNPAMRLVWSFGSESRKNLALLSYSAAKRPAAQTARTLAYVAILNAVGAAVIRSMLQDVKDRDDDEVFDKKHWNAKRLAAAAVTEPFQGIPILGGIVQDVINRGFGIPTFSGSPLDVSRAAGPVKRLPDLIGGNLEMEEALRDVDSMLSVMGLFNDSIAAAASLAHLVKDIYGKPNK